MKNWRTKLVASLTGLWNLVPIVADGIQQDDWKAIGVTVGAVWTIWLTRDAIAKSGPVQ